MARVEAHLHLLFQTQFLYNIIIANLFLEVKQPESSQFNHGLHSQVIWDTSWKSLQLLNALYDTSLDSEKGQGD